MYTVVEQLNEDIIALKDLLNDFLLNHAKIKYSPITTDSSIVIIGSDYRWETLNTEGKQLQSRIYKKYNNFYELTTVLITDLPNNSMRDFKENAKSILNIIAQKDIWDSSIQKVLSKALNCLDNQLKILNTIYDPKSGTYFFVPDTNALLTNPEIEKWEFPEIQTFEIILVPVVLSELDKLKVFHNNQVVREKAQSLIRRIQEFRRRGRITEGVTLVKGKSSLRAIAIEPNFNKSLPWLQQDNNDDKFIASFIEVMKMHPNSTVTLITSDINLQNKAEFARLPFIEPPRPRVDNTQT